LKIIDGWFEWDNQCNFYIVMEVGYISKVDDMCVNGQLDQIKVKGLELMVNEEDEIFLGGKEKVIQWMLFIILPLATKHLIILKATKH
jgi:hypothetical protein